MKKIISIFLLILIVFSIVPVSFASTPIWSQPKGIYGGEIDKVIASQGFSTDSIVFAGGLEGFYVSSDGGNSYASINLSPGYNLTFEGITDFALSKDFTVNKKLYIGTKNGIYMSEDYGKTIVPFQFGIAVTYITQIAADPVTDTLLAVGVSFEKREDGKVLNNNFIMANKASSARWETVEKITSDYVTAICSYNDEFFVGTEYGEVFRFGKTKDEIFKTPSGITSMSVSKNGIGIATLGDGIFVSDDFKNFSQELEGQSISCIEFKDKNNLIALGRTKTVNIKESGTYKANTIPFPSTNLSMSVVGSNIFIASYEYGVIKSSDYGKTFAISNSGINNVNTSCVSFSPRYLENKTVYVGTHVNGLFISHDGGKTFKNSGNQDTHDILEVKELSNGKILVGTLGEGIFISSDEGETFRQLEVLKNHSIGCIYEYNSKIFIGTENDGLYFSNLDLENIQKAGSIASYDVNINYIKGTGTLLFVATNGGNLYESLDGGETFKEIGNNKFKGMAITGFDTSGDLSQNGVIFVGTSSGEYISYDRGANFYNVFDLGTTWADGVSISPNYANDGCIVIGAWGSSGTTTGNIYLTKNRGISYENIGTGTSNRYIIGVALSPDFYYGKSGSIYALTSSGGIFTYTFENKTEIRLTVGKNEIIVNGTKKLIDVAPYIKNSRTLVPVRFISEALGAIVYWDSQKREVKIVLNDMNIVLTIGSPSAYINGVKIQIDNDNPTVVPEITNGRTFVPLRFIAESFGANVVWNEKAKEIIITLGG